MKVSIASAVTGNCFSSDCQNPYSVSDCIVWTVEARVPKTPGSMWRLSKLGQTNKFQTPVKIMETNV